jgi:hypothetical protein
VVSVAAAATATAIVTTPATGRQAETEEQTEQRMRAVAADLTAAGLDSGVYETRGVFDVRATLRRDGCGPVEVICDADGYSQVSYWHPPGASPAQVTATIAAVLAAITNSDMTVPG